MINEQGDDMNTSFKVIQNLRGRWIDRHIILSSTNFQFTKKKKRWKEGEEKKWRREKHLEKRKAPIKG